MKCLLQASHWRNGLELDAGAMAEDDSVGGGGGIGLGGGDGGGSRSI